MPVPIERNVAGQSIWALLFSDGDIVTTPTIAAGDFTISIDGGVEANLTTLPYEDPAGSGRVRIPLSQAESNGVALNIAWHDAVVAGNDWDDGGMTVYTDTDSIGDISTALAALAAAVAALSVVAFPAGSVEWTYRVTNSATGLPVQGVQVWVTTDIAGANIIWRGDTDAQGYARDVLGRHPQLNPGTYYFWRYKPGYTDTDPDTEVVA